jgi:hypothetical protein
MFPLGREAQHLAPIDSNHNVHRCAVRLRHAPESDSGEFNRSILMEEEIQAGVEDNPIDRRRRRNQVWRLRRFVSTV